MVFGVGFRRLSPPPAPEGCQPPGESEPLTSGSPPVAATGASSGGGYGAVGSSSKTPAARQPDNMHLSAPLPHPKHHDTRLDPACTLSEAIDRLGPHEPNIGQYVRRLDPLTDVLAHCLSLCMLSHSPPCCSSLALHTHLHR